MILQAFLNLYQMQQMQKKSLWLKLQSRKKITDNGFIALIKKYCDVDIISAINIQHQLEE